MGRGSGGLSLQSSPMGRVCPQALTSVGMRVRPQDRGDSNGTIQTIHSAEF
jgi:hypothetical protein